MFHNCSQSSRWAVNVQIPNNISSYPQAFSFFCFIWARQRSWSVLERTHTSSHRNHWIVSKFQIDFECSAPKNIWNRNIVIYRGIYRKTHINTIEGQVVFFENCKLVPELVIPFIKVFGQVIFPYIGYMILNSGITEFLGVWKGIKLITILFVINCWILYAFFDIFMIGTSTELD